MPIRASAAPAPTLRGPSEFKALDAAVETLGALSVTGATPFVRWCAYAVRANGVQPEVD